MGREMTGGSSEGLFSESSPLHYTVPAIEMNSEMAALPSMNAAKNLDVYLWMLLSTWMSSVRRAGILSRQLGNSLI